MKIVALEFATPRRSVAVSIDGEVRGHAAEQGGRAAHAFALIQSALDQARIRRDEIDCVAVGVGPGSYAGIRIAIAVAQGWHLATHVKLAAVSSADAVAAQAHENGWRGPLRAFIDAQRNELFSAEYTVHASGWTLVKPFALAEGLGQRSGIECVRFDITQHDSDRCLVPDAAAVARLAEAQGCFVAASKLEPIYLRKAEFVKTPAPRSF